MSLVEVLIVVALLGIFAGVVVTRWDSGFHDQLTGAAQVVVSDIGYARHLAITFGSRYAINFDLTNHRYQLQHTGDDPTLDNLPPSPYRQPDDPPDRQTTDLARLPIASATIELAAVHKQTPTPVDVTDLEFGPAGETARSEATVIWLAAGQGADRRYLAIEVDPVTGLAAIGGFRSALPMNGP